MSRLPTTCYRMSPSDRTNLVSEKLVISPATCGTRGDRLPSLAHHSERAAIAACEDRLPVASGQGPVAVLIVDDQAPFRRAAAAVVRMTGGFTVVGEAASGEEAVELANTLRPAVVLMDINLPGMTGIEATGRITDARPETLVLLLSTYRPEDLPSEVGSFGFAAYVNKDEFGPDILRRTWEAHIRTGLSGSIPEEP